MKILIFLQITSPWDWRSFWALLRGFHLGAEHRLPTTHCVPNTIPDNPCKSPAATWVLTWALKRGWTSPNRWHVPASKNLCGVHEQFSDPCAVSIYSLWCKIMGQFGQIPKKGGREFLMCQGGRGWYTDFCCAVSLQVLGVSCWESLERCAWFPRLWISQGMGLWLEGSLSSRPTAAAR